MLKSDHFRDILSTRNDGGERQIKMRYQAELWDQMQFFFKEYNDHQIHGVIYFEDQLDRECLKKAVLLSMDRVPILKSRYVEGKMRPHWERIDAWNDEVATFEDSDDIEIEIMRFLVNKTNEFQGPQLMIKVVRGSTRDTLCIVMNHMVCDGGGFKEYLYLLSSIYTNLKMDPDYLPGYETNRSRSLRQVYRRIHLADRLKILFTPNHMAKHSSGLHFPLSGATDISPFILTHKLSSNRFQVLKEYGRKFNVTINDILLAAYLRALYRVMDIPSGKSLALPCMIDLRRFLRDGKAVGICNLTSSIICDIGPDIGGSFAETVMKVKYDMDQKKRNFPGLNGLDLLRIIFKLLPYSKVKKLVRQKFINPFIAMSNIGIIDKTRLLFDHLPVRDAFITGSIKYPPYFQLALTGFNDSISFTISQYGSAKDRERIGNFFKVLDEELPI